MSDDNKPREFWIQDLAEATYRATDVSCYDEEVNPSIIDEWHVIEHSAYAALQKENEELKQKFKLKVLYIADLESVISSHNKQIPGLEKENAALRTSIKEVCELLECNKTFHSLGGIDDCEPCKLKAKIKAKDGDSL